MTLKTQKLYLDLFTYTLLLVGALMMVIPFFWMVSTSFKLPADQFTKTLIPPHFTWQNYRELFAVDLDFKLLFENSFFISAMITIGQLLTCSMGAFCFAVVNFKGRDLLFTALLATMLIPFHVTLIPNFIIFRWLNLIGTSVPLWLPAFWGGAFGTFLIRQYFLTIPRDLVDAARVDGATLPDIFFRVYMPRPLSGSLPPRAPGMTFSTR